MTGAVRVDDCLHALDRNIWTKTHGRRSFRRQASARPPPFYFSDNDDDNEVHVIRRLLGHGSSRRKTGGLFEPPVPQNSVLGNRRIGSIVDEDDEDAEEDHVDVFHTAIFRDPSDPNAFKLPSVFASDPGTLMGMGRGEHHHRLIPTVSENTFLSSNLRANGTSRDYDVSRQGGNKSPNNNNSDNNYSSLPLINRNANSLVSLAASVDGIESHSVSERRKRRRMKRRERISGNSLRGRSKGETTDKNGDGDREEEEEEEERDGIDSRDSSLAAKEKESGDLFQESSRNSKQLDRVGSSDIMTSEMMRRLTLDREKTTGSLQMDESFVPMSVTITKLSTGQDRQQDFRSMTSSSLSGSLGVSRETSLASSEYFSSPVCACPVPQPNSADATSCCGGFAQSGSHDSWCPRQRSPGNRERTPATCVSCGGVIRPGKTKKKRPKGANRKHSSRSDYRMDMITPDTAVNGLDLSHNRLECKGQGKNTGKDINDNRTRKHSIQNNDKNLPHDQRVRFDNHVTNVPADDFDEVSRSPLKQSSFMEARVDNNSTVDDETRFAKESASRNKNVKDNKLFVKRTKQRNAYQTAVASAVHIPDLGVSVHSYAYDLALKDSRLATSSMVKKSKSSRREKGRESSKKPGDGIVFSYFPLLKRPFSESSATLDLGFRAKAGEKVKPKNYMKHIFGKTNMADYYPGGKKFRPPERNDAN